MSDRSREVFVHRSRLPFPAEDVFRWHTAPGALARLTPPWERVEVVTEGKIEPGAITILRVGTWPFKMRWVARITLCAAGREFRDVQIAGPFRTWEHVHRMEPDGPDACWLEDSVSYTTPGGWPGHLLAGWFVRRKLRRMFEHRHRVTREALAMDVPGAAR